MSFREYIEDAYYRAADFMQENRRWLVPVAVAIGAGAIGYLIYKRFSEATPNSGGGGGQPGGPGGSVLPSRIKVVLNPEHGGADPGAVYKRISGFPDPAVSEDLLEKDVNLEVANLVRKNLELVGINVIMTREGDQFMTLEERVKIANKESPGAFVTIATNSVKELTRPDGDCPNVQDRTIILFYREDSRPLAEAISREVKKVQHRSILGKVIGTRISEVRQQNLYVLREATVPSVSVELGFICNWATFRTQWWRNPYFKQDLAKAIADGILQYTGAIVG